MDVFLHRSQEVETNSLPAGSAPDIPVAEARGLTARFDKPGAGVFQRFEPALCLTAPGMLRSTWRLPSWFYPDEEKSSLSYHNSLSRWRIEKDYVLLNSVGRGQEFVLDCQEYPEAVNWLRSILRWQN